MKYFQTHLVAVQLFIIVSTSDQENSIMRPLCKFKLQTMAKILKIGSITFFGECSHWNRDRSNILFRSHWLHSSTSYRPSILQGPEGVKFIILPETIPTGRLYLRSGHLFLNTWHEVGKSLSLFFPQTEKKWMWIFFEETYWPHFRYL